MSTVTGLFAPSHTEYCMLATYIPVFRYTFTVHLYQVGSVLTYQPYCDTESHHFASFGAVDEIIVLNVLLRYVLAVRQIISCRGPEKGEERLPKDFNIASSAEEKDKTVLKGLLDWQLGGHKYRLGILLVAVAFIIPSLL